MFGCITCTACHARLPTLCDGCARLVVVDRSTDLVLFLCDVMSQRYTSAQDAFDAMRTRGLLAREVPA